MDELWRLYTNLKQKFEKSFYKRDGYASPQEAQELLTSPAHGDWNGTSRGGEDSDTPSSRQVILGGLQTEHPSVQDAALVTDARAPGVILRTVSQAVIGRKV